MLRIICKSKIHNATVTDANLKYPGSITIDKKLLKNANIVEGEKVQIVNINNGSRIETYVVAGKASSGTICMNGAAARWAQVGDNIIIISYGLFSENEIKNFKTRIVHVDKKNRLTKIK